MKQVIKIIFLFAVMLVLVRLCVAADNAGGTPATTEAVEEARPHGAMELFGIGPELFENRGMAWVHCIAKIVKEAVIEIGAIVLLIYLTKQNIDQKKQLKEVKTQAADLSQRVNNQGQRIHEVALATTPGAGGEINIPNADVQINPTGEKRTG